MTLGTTHLALESIVFWSLIGQNERDRFKNKKAYFWFVAFFSVFPDFDIFFYLHRGPSHSLVIPTLMIIIGLLVQIAIKRSFFDHFFSKPASTTFSVANTSIQRDYAFIGRCIMYAGFFWIMHILLDWEVPVALFYPLSDRAYTITFVGVISLLPWSIFPFRIIGGFFKITGIPYLQGLATYFINWSPEERIQAFGSDTLYLIVPDLWLHVLIFVVFIAYVAIPNLPKIKRISIPQIIHKIDLPILVGGIILLLIGSLMGPVLGPQMSDSKAISRSLEVSEKVFSPAIAFNFETTSFLFDPSATYHISAFLNVTSSKMVFLGELLISSTSRYNEFISYVGNLFSSHNMSDPLNATEFYNEYKVSYGTLIAAALAINDSNLPLLRLNESLSSGSYSLAYVISNWNMTALLNQESLIQNVELNLTIISSRYSIYLIGWVVILVSGVLILIATLRQSLEERLKGYSPKK